VLFPTPPFNATNAQTAEVVVRAMAGVSAWCTSVHERGYSAVVVCVST
jgi:hypothetical protein